MNIDNAMWQAWTSYDRSFIRVFKQAIPKKSLLWELMKQ